MASAKLNESQPMSKKSGDGFHRAVGVEGAQDEVSGERGFNADFGRFFISHFSDHDHVRVGTEKGAHGLRQR